MAATINNTLVKIETVTVGSGGASSITFSSIPSTYTDLCLKYSIRTSSNTLSTVYDYGHLEINGNTSSLSIRQLYGENGTAYSNNASSVFYVWPSSSGATASTFASGELYFPNYTSSNYKSFSLDQVDENNGTPNIAVLAAGLWSNTSAINQLTIAPNSGTYVQYSTATLYGVTATPSTTKASGGIIYQDATYMYHVFPYTSTFTPSSTLSCDVLTIAGGGAGGAYNGGYNGAGGGGGAGGLVYSSSQSLTATNYTVTVGGGGSAGSNGSNSNVTGGSLSLTAAVGGGKGASQTSRPGGSGNGTAGNSGGSGGGAAHWDLNGTVSGGTATSGQGNNGGSATSTGGNAAGAGGGGAGAVGGNASVDVSGAGGVGSSSYSSWAIATSTGQIVGGTGYYAGGGGGGGNDGGKTGGNGGGGSGIQTLSSAGTSNTGGGGGGAGGSQSSTSGFAGGSGIVIIRYAK